MLTMTRWSLLWVLVSASLAAQELTDSLSLRVEEQIPQGMVYEAGETCHFSWQIVDGTGQEVTGAALEQKFQQFLITLTQAVPGQELTMEMKKLPLTTAEYQWKIPQSQENGKYWLTLTAVAKTGLQDSITRRVPIYARAFYKELERPLDLDTCVHLLMDWTGKRGYYLRTSPLKAFERAKSACNWLRQNAEPSFYTDYLKTIEKIEKTDIAELTVYCPLLQAKLEIDQCVVGYFQQWNPQKKAYLLKPNLPVSRENFYTIRVSKDNRAFTTFHTHIEKSECVIEELYEIIYLTLVTKNILSQTAIEGKNWSRRLTTHRIPLYSKKVQILQVALQDGPVLKLIVSPRQSFTLEIKKSGNFFAAFQDNKRYEFIGNEVNLLEY